MKILIVDDSSFKRKSLGYVIERHGHEVMEAVHGEEGLEKARSSRPDIIVSDLLMPKMDGFNFLRTTMNSMTGQDIPKGSRERPYLYMLECLPLPILWTQWAQTGLTGRVGRWM